jgi:hypothetical protein
MFIRGEYFSEFNGERFPLFVGLGNCLILINSGEKSLKVVEIKLFSHTNLPWNNTHFPVLYFQKTRPKNSLRNGEELTLIYILMRTTSKTLELCLSE